MLCNASGWEVLKLKRPWRDGTTHLMMTPLENARSVSQVRAFSNCARRGAGA